MGPTIPVPQEWIFSWSPLVTVAFHIITELTAALIQINNRQYANLLYFDLYLNIAYAAHYAYYTVNATSWDSMHSEARMDDGLEHRPQ